MWGAACILCGHLSPVIIRGSDPVHCPCPWDRGFRRSRRSPLGCSHSSLPPSHPPTLPPTPYVRSCYKPRLAEQTGSEQGGRGRETSSPTCAPEVGLPAQCSLAALRVSLTLSSLQEIQEPSELSCVTQFLRFSVRLSAGDKVRGKALNNSGTAMIDQVSILSPSPT